MKVKGELLTVIQGQELPLSSWLLQSFSLLTHHHHRRRHHHYQANAVIFIVNSSFIAMIVTSAYVNDHDGHY